MKNWFWEVGEFFRNAVNYFSDEEAAKRVDARRALSFEERANDSSDVSAASNIGDAAVYWEHAQRLDKAAKNHSRIARFWNGRDRLKAIRRMDRAVDLYEKVNKNRKAGECCVELSDFVVGANNVSLVKRKKKGILALQRAIGLFAKNDNKERCKDVALKIADHCEFLSRHYHHLSPSTSENEERRVKLLEGAMIYADAGSSYRELAAQYLNGTDPFTGKETYNAFANKAADDFVVNTADKIAMGWKN